MGPGVHRRICARLTIPDTPDKREGGQKREALAPRVSSHPLLGARQSDLSSGTLPCVSQGQVLVSSGLHPASPPAQGSQGGSAS